MNQTLKVSLAISQLVRQDGFACQDEGQWGKPLGSWMAKANVPTPSILDWVFKGVP
jgi:hypothetical protein